MKKIKIGLTLLLSLTLILSLAACGSSAETADSAAQETDADGEDAAETDTEDAGASDAGTASAGTVETEPVEAEEPETEEDPYAIAGEYTGFAIGQSGSMLPIDETGTSVLTLNEDGTGHITFNEDGMAISSWEKSEELIDLTFEDGTVLQGAFSDGMIGLDIDGDSSRIIYYAAEGVDTSDIEFASREDFLEAQVIDEIKNAPDSRTGRLLKSRDPADPIHISYEATYFLEGEEEGRDFHCEAQAADGAFSLLMENDEQTSLIVYTDGVLYQLEPSKKTGVKKEVELSVIQQYDVIAMDEVYQLILGQGRTADYTEDTVDFNGGSYHIEEFTERSYEDGTADAGAEFWYRDDGSLHSIYRDACISLDIPAAEFYDITFDSVIDHSLFDISGYLIV